MEEIQDGHCPCSKIQGGLPTTLPPPCRAPGAGQLFQPHRRTYGGVIRVGGGVHDSYTFQCGLVGYFTSPGIDTK